MKLFINSRTHRDSERLTETNRDSERLRETQRDSQRLTETQRDSQRLTETQRDSERLIASEHIFILSNKAINFKITPEEPSVALDAPPFGIWAHKNIPFSQIDLLDNQTNQIVFLQTIN